MRSTSLALLLLGALSSATFADKAPPPEPDPQPETPQPETPQPETPQPETAPVPEPKPVPDKPAEKMPPKKKVVLVDVMFRRKGLSPDLTLSFGVNTVHTDNERNRWWTGRARAGVVLYNEPYFLITGISGMFSALDSASLGIEFQYIHLWYGFWFQGSVHPISDRGSIVGGSLGYTLFGVEYQRRVSGAEKGDQALIVTLNVPLGVVRVALKKDIRRMELPMADDSLKASR